jgi:hypothetical protein
MLLHLTAVFEGDMPEMPDLMCNNMWSLTGVARNGRPCAVGKLMAGAVSDDRLPARGYSGTMRHLCLFTGVSSCF